MALTVKQRAEVRRTLAQLLSGSNQPWPLTRADTQAAINGIDDYFDANAAAINQAFPAGARAALTVAQKAAIVGYVALKRAGGG